MGLTRKQIDSLVPIYAQQASEPYKRTQETKMQQADADARLAQLIKGQQLEQEAAAQDLSNAQAMRQKYGPETDVAVGRARIGGVDPLMSLIRRRQLDQESMTPGQKAADVAFGKEYSDYIAGGGKKTVEKSMSQLQRAKESFKQPGAGNLLERGASYLPEALRTLVTPESKAREDMVRNAIQMGLRQTLGSQFTEKEAEAFMRRAIDPRLSNEENMARIQMAIDELNQKAEEKERSAQLFERTGSLRGLGAAGQAARPSIPQVEQQGASTPQDKVTVISPDGRRGMIPRANLQRALQQGYKAE